MGESEEERVIAGYKTYVESILGKVRAAASAGNRVEAAAGVNEIIGELTKWQFRARRRGSFKGWTEPLKGQAEEVASRDKNAKIAATRTAILEPAIKEAKALVKSIEVTGETEEEKVLAGFSIYIKEILAKVEAAASVGDRVEAAAGVDELLGERTKWELAAGRKGAFKGWTEPLKGQAEEVALHDSSARLAATRMAVLEPAIKKAKALVESMI
jgi:hypothetical protein